MTDQPEKAPQVVGGCPDCGGCAHGPDGRCPLDTEKVSSLSAALPDVRALRDPKRFGVEALIAVAEGRYANIPDGTVLRPSRLTNAFLDGAQYVLAELEAALRSREEERAEPADAPSCTNPLCGCSDRQEAFAALRSRSNYYLADLLQEWHDEEDLDPADHRWSRALLHETIRRLRPAQPEEAAQRATSSSSAVSSRRAKGRGPVSEPS